jgi:hypothetical protein
LDEIEDVTAGVAFAARDARNILPGKAAGFVDDV